MKNNIIHPPVSASDDSRLREIAETIRTFTAAAVATGLLTKVELDVAIARLVESASSNPPALKRDRLITFTAAGKQLDVCARTVKRMLDDGELEGRRLRLGAANTMRVYESSIDAILTPASRKEASSQQEGAERS